MNPEKTNTWTLGLVFNPTRNLTGSIDWWSIKIDDAINPPAPASVLQQCLQNGLLCNLIHRDAQQTLWLFPNGVVDAFTANIGGYKTTGLDLAVNWTQPIGALGSSGLHFLGSYMSKWEYEPIKGGGKFDCAGFFGSQCSYTSTGPNN